MGTKGRDVCLWLFFILAIVSVFMTRPLRCATLEAMLLAAASLVYYWRRYLPVAVRKSRSFGLRMAVLLPVNRHWAKLLLWLDGERMNGFSGACEVHLKGVRGGLGDYLKLLAADLEIAEKKFPGHLFLWEASVPLPLIVRRKISQGAAGGTAFLKKGGWPVPRFPFVEMDLNRGRIKHGAVLNKKEMIC